MRRGERKGVTWTEVYAKWRGQLRKLLACTVVSFLLETHSINWQMFNFFTAPKIIYFSLHLWAFHKRKIWGFPQLRCWIKVTWLCWVNYVEELVFLYIQGFETYAKGLVFHFNEGKMEPLMDTHLKRSFGCLFVAWSNSTYTNFVESGSLRAPHIEYWILLYEKALLPKHSIYLSLHFSTTYH